MSSSRQRCCIPGCRSNWERLSEPVETFPLPRNEMSRKVWLRCIPPELHHLDPVVCIKHFPRSFLTSGSTLHIGGEVSLHQKVKLRPNAFPTIFPSVLEPLPQEYPNERNYPNWQGGSVVMAQGTPGVNTGAIDIAPNPVNMGGAPMRAPMPPSSFMNLSETMRARGNQFIAATMYPPNYPPKMMNLGNPPAQAPAMPLYPAEVRFKKLPFYDLLGDLLKPSTLSISTTSRDPTAHYVFFLTPRQASDVSMNREVGPGTRNEYIVQVQMRFCALDTTSEQDDQFPPGLSVKINGKLAPLPPQNNQPNKPNEIKRPSKPINISHMVKLCPSVSNNVQVSWNPDYQRGYVLAINLVRKLSSMELLERLKKKGARHADYTTGLIKDKLSDSDNDIATTSLRVSLICPLGKMRMQTATRASTCLHLQCFDGLVYISMNEKRPTWTCPVCNKPALYDNLVIDGYFQNVLESPLLGESNEIELHKDGSWAAHDETQEHSSLSHSHKGNASPKDDHIHIEEIKDDDDEDTTVARNGVNKPLPEKLETPAVPVGLGAPKEVELVDLTETDDEDVPPPPPTKEAPSQPVTIQQPPIKQLDHVFSDSTSSLSTTTRSSPSVINLDSPSPSPPNHFGPIHSTIPPQSASTLLCRRLPPDSRYHPY